MQSEASTLLTDGAAEAGGADETSTTQAATAADASATGATSSATGADATTSTEEANPEAKADGAPESYELKAPEGRDFDPDVLGAFADVAKDLNLTNESAQKVIDKIAPALAEKFERNVAAARAQWETDTRSDTEIGGDKLDQNLGVARKALESFGTPALKELLNTSGLGNHPEVVRLLVRAGKAISEDSMVSGTGTSTPADPRGLYAASNMNP
jgi:hypothetical protein